MIRWGKLLGLLFILLFFSSCFYNKTFKGDYFGYREEVDKSQVVKADPVIGEVILPSEENPLLQIEVKKRPYYAVKKVNQYERVIKSNDGSIVWGTMIGGMLAALPAVGEMADSTRSGQGFVHFITYSALGGAIGMLLGSAIVTTKKDRKKPFEEETDEVLRLEKSEHAYGKFPGQEVQISAPSLHQEVTVITDSDGMARADLASILMINDWSPYNHSLELEIRVGDDKKMVTVDPNYFLLPYIKITRRRDNIRSGPSARYRVIAHCYRNELYRIVGKRGNWYKIKYHGKTAWTHKSNGKEVLASEYRFDPAKPPQLVARAAFMEPSGNNILDAEETAKIRVTVQNIGKGPDYNVRLVVKPLKLSNRISLEKEVTFGTIFPGESVQKDIRLTADYRVPDYTNRLRLEFVDQLGFPPDPIEISFNSRHELKPRFVFHIDRIDDDNIGRSFGDNDQQIEAGETIEVWATIKNEGEGKAEDVRAILEARAPNLFIVGNKTIKVGTLAPGESKSINFAFSANKLYNAGAKLPLFVTIKERRQRYSLAPQSLGLVMNQFIPSTQLLTVTPKQRETTIPDEFKIEDVPRTDSDKPYAVAVIIGNRDYQKADVPRVEFATRDAALVRQYVIQMFGYRPENVIYLENATKADFDQVFGSHNNPHGKLADYIKPWQSEVFIYYTGHGAPDLESGDSYFVPVDCDPNYVKLTGYPLYLFYRNLSKLQAKRITVAIDACFSGQSSAGYLIKNISSLYLKIKDPILQIPNLNLFTSSRADQVSHWYPEKNHSLFTFFFLAGIKKQWNLMHSQISLGMLYDYISENVNRYARRLYGREQNPTFWGKRQDSLY